MRPSVYVAKGTWKGLVIFFSSTYTTFKAGQRQDVPLLNGCLHQCSVLFYFTAPLTSFPCCSNGQMWHEAAWSAQGADEPFQKPLMLPQLRAARGQLCPCHSTGGVGCPARATWMGVRAEVREQRFSLNRRCQSYAPVKEITHAFPAWPRLN